MLERLVVESSRHNLSCRWRLNTDPVFRRARDDHEANAGSRKAAADRAMHNWFLRQPSCITGRTRGLPDPKGC